MHFLIVEDDPGILLVYEKKLTAIRRAFPNSILSFTPSLAEAKRIASTPPFPDLVILDLTLPGSTWQETLAETRAFVDRSALLIVTGQPIEKVRSVLLDPEIEVLQKTPELFSGNAILETIARVLNHRAEKVTARLQRNITGMREILGQDATQTNPSSQ